MQPWIERSAGVLLHISSLPSGRLGGDARRFMDFMERAGLRVWQLLPVGPTAKYGNPFESASVFAGNAGFVPPGTRVTAQAREAYREANADWLDDWSLFSALKAEQQGLPWWQWPPDLRHREPAALAAARRRLAARIERECRVQCAFDRAWQEFKADAGQRGLQIFGDVPLFVSQDSADVWAQRELFEVDVEGRCEAVVGVPPDAFSADGQWWGFPPYRWARMAQTGWTWWKRRFEVQARRYDLVRLDHFRGFAAWWRIPASARTAAEGQWIPGPADAAIECLRPVLGGARFVAEDLGVITEDVVALRQRLGIPGMRVLQFAFDGDPHNPHLPQQHGADTVCYTGTHDNDTTMGWWASLPPQEREAFVRHVGPAPRMPEALLDCAWASPAPLAIAPLQDLLRLGSEARMNQPGIAEGNWHWRFRWEQIPVRLADDLRRNLLHHRRVPA